MDLQNERVIYRGMSQQQLNAAYNNTLAVADSAEHLARWRTLSQQWRDTSPDWSEHRYGPAPRNCLDLFPVAAPGAPLFVFLHGGYWQRNDKSMFSFLAAGPNAHAINVAIVGYSLAPQASLTEIVAEIDLALDYLSAHANLMKFNPSAVFVGGWSAGGHLAAMAGRHPLLSGSLPISGVFDLEPIGLSDLNDKLQLSTDEIAALSALATQPMAGKPCHLFVGGEELPELRRQSESFHASLQGNAMLSHLEGHNHFTILDELRDPDGAITCALRDLTR